MQKYRIHLGLFFLLSAYILLIPGITEPVLHVKTTLDKSELASLGKEAILASPAIPMILLPMATEVLDQVQVSGEIVINDVSKSILVTSQELYNDGNRLVAFLILFFSVLIPTIKLLLLSIAVVLRQSRLDSKLAKASAAMSKWSMADVFVIALIISFLAMKASSGQSAMVTNEIALESGFYYFLAYCCLSILSSQLMTEHQIKQC